MKSFIKKPYDLLESKTFRSLYVFGGGVFAFIFLWIFEPFGIKELTAISLKLQTVGLFIGVSLVLMVIHFYILQSYLLKTYNVLNTIVWIILSLFIIGVSVSIVNAYLFNYGQLNLSKLFIIQARTLSVNIIFVIIFVLIHYNYSLQLRLKKANKLNAELKNIQVDSKSDSKVVINSDNKKEGITLSIDTLLYITAIDNYVKVFYINNGEIENTLIRYSLAKIEQDNQQVFELFRCHKSYIINKIKIESIIGNTGGYKIKLKNYDAYIPLSRKFNNSLSNLF